MNPNYHPHRLPPGGRPPGPVFLVGNALIPQPPPPPSDHIVLQDGQLSAVTSQDLATLRARAHQLGIGTRPQPIAHHRQPAPGPTTNAQNSFTRPPAMPMAPPTQAGPSRPMTSPTSRQASPSGAQLLPAESSGASAPLSATDIIGWIPNAMNTMHTSISNRLTRIEELAQGSSNVAERLERLEREVSSSRDHTHSVLRQVVNCIDNLALVSSKRFQMVEDCMRRVDHAVGTSVYPEPVASTSSCATAKGGARKPLFDRLEALEYLLEELLEKANDPEATRSPVIRNDAAVNTESAARVHTGVQCLPPSERRERSVTVTPNYTESGTDAPSEKSFTHADEQPVKVHGNAEAHRLPSLSNPQVEGPPGLSQDDSEPHHSSGRVLAYDTPPSHGQWTTLLPPQAFASPLPIPKLHNDDLAIHFAPDPLKPAVWQDDMSELSSRDTSPVDELRNMIFGAQERAEGSSHAPGPSNSREVSQARSAASDAPFAHVAPRQLHATPETSTTRPLPKSKPTLKSNISLPAHISPPIMAMSRTPTPMLHEARSRSPSVGCIDGPATFSRGESVDRLFDDDEAVDSSPPKPQPRKKRSPKKLTTPRAPREETPLHFPESEEETVPSTSGRASTVLSRRQRSLSLESLSSLSSITSTHSSVAVERELRRSSSAVVNLLTQPSASANVLRPPKKKRKTDPRASSSKSSTVLKTHQVGASASAPVQKQKRRQKEKAVRYWEVIEGYNGPCDWPGVIADMRNLIMCDQCECWYHWGCVGINDNDPRAGQEEIDFTCPPCEESITRHGIARKVRNHREDHCARPECNMNLETNEYFLERVVARVPHNLNTNPPEFVWLFKWVGYGVADATWEVDFPIGRDSYIKEFEKTARREGFAINDLDTRIVLKEAQEGGWR